MDFKPSGRVVVTGVGAVTPLGLNVDTFWSNLLAGKSGVSLIECMDTSEYPTKIAGEIKDFNPEDWLDKKEARRIDRFLAFSVAVGRMALEDSGIELNDELREEFGVLIGSGIGGLSFLAEQHRRQIEGGPSRISPFLVPYMIPDMASGYTSIVLGLKGPNTCVVSACSTGADAIGTAYHMVKRGDAVAMIAGGSEAPINELGLGGFCAARAMTTNNEALSKASRPFDLNRDGFIMAEGASVLVLEDMDHAVARCAKIYGEVVGYGMSGDANHITQPDPNGDGAMRSMKKAMRNAGVTPEDIGYVNAHGTSTPYNDKFETIGIKRAFGDAAYKVPVSSTKSSIGHALGAAGSIEAIICLLSLRDSILPATINYETPDPDCDLDVVPNTPRPKSYDYALTNSFGFGGHNVSLILKKFVA